ncbi:hypothetical protein Tco_0903309 [Tanacetum coccineum]
MAPMTSSDPEVKTYSKTYLNNYETLKKQYDDLFSKQLQTKFESATYKRGLDNVEAQLVTYRKNEVLFSEEVAVLKRDVEFKQYEINNLKAEFEKLKQEKDAIDFKIEKFDKASKDLDSVVGSSNNWIRSKQEWVSDNEDEVESLVVVEKKLVFYLFIQLMLLDQNNKKNQLGKQLGRFKSVDGLVPIEMFWRDLPNKGGYTMSKLMKITLVQMDAQTQGRQELKDQEDEVFESILSKQKV